MPNDNNNIERQRNIINKLKALLEKYTKIYEEDGIIDSEEQASINRMNEKIARAEVHLAELESGKTTTETSTKKEVPTEKTTIDEGNLSSELDAEVLAKKQQTRVKQLDKMETGTQKIEKAIKKKTATPEQIEKAIVKYETALEKIRTKAFEDGEIDEKEQEKIDLMQEKLDKMREELNGNEGETSDEVIEEIPEELEEALEVKGEMPNEEEITKESVSTEPISKEKVAEYQSRLTAILARLGL